MAMYSYAGLNPIRLVDRNGEDQFLYFWSSEQSETGVGHMAWGVGTEQKQTFYEANPSTVAFSKMKTPFRSEGSMQSVLASSDKGQHGQEPALILKAKTTPEQDKKGQADVEQFFVDHKRWTPVADCADVGKTGLKAAGYDAGMSPMSTPQEFAQDILENNKKAIDVGQITTLKGNLKDFGGGTGAVHGFARNIINEAGEKAYDLLH